MFMLISLGSTDISPAESIADISTVDTKALENVHTVLHDNVKAPYVAYQHVPWKLHVRKEVRVIMYMITSLILQLPYRLIWGKNVLLVECYVEDFKICQNIFYKIFPPNFFLFTVQKLIISKLEKVIDLTSSASAMGVKITILYSMLFSLQLFTPTETIDNQAVIDLIFCQIVADVFSASMRIEKQDRMRMLSIMRK